MCRKVSRTSGVSNGEVEVLQPAEMQGHVLWPGQSEEECDHRSGGGLSLVQSAGDKSPASLGDAHVRAEADVVTIDNMENLDSLEPPTEPQEQESEPC